MLIITGIHHVSSYFHRTYEYRQFIVSENEKIDQVYQNLNSIIYIAKFSAQTEFNFERSTNARQK